MNNILLIVLPMAVVYAVFRAWMYWRAGKTIWMAQFIIITCFMLAVLAYEIWMTYGRGGSAG